ncbi:MAG: EamA family transporter RarD [bacterium]|nr:EamA family transporter RarD [bacterium]
MSANLRLGVISAAAAFSIWGLAALYWRMLAEISALQLLAHRIVWSLPILFLWLTLSGRWKRIGQALTNIKTASILLVTTVLIAVNWGTFIWAVNNERVLHASLGYFINPLVSVLLGLVVLGERVNRFQTAAIVLAAFGVGYMAYQFGSLPWVSIALASSFGLYGLVRKVIQVEAVEGLAIETSVLTVVATAYLVMLEQTGDGAFTHGSLTTDLLLVGAGLITVVPLVLFTIGARNLPLSTLGLLQFIAPIGQFLLGVAVFGESFTTTHIVTFAFIWVALVIYVVDLRRRLRAG